VSVPASPATIERQQFDRDGYLCPVDALSPAKTAHYRALYLDFHARHKQRLDALRAGERWQINTDTHFVFEWVDALTREPGILDAVDDSSVARVRSIRSSPPPCPWPCGWPGE
jgi:hypothetical protein